MEFTPKNLKEIITVYMAYLHNNISEHHELCNHLELQAHDHIIELLNQNHSNNIYITKLLEEISKSRIEEASTPNVDNSREVNPYISDFTSRYNAHLFLEEDHDKVKLSDVYIEQNYEQINSLNSQADFLFEMVGLFQFIKNFINQYNKNILIIEANAGMGKSCLLQRLVYDKENMFEKKNVFCLPLYALGEINNETIKDPIKNICEHISINKSNLNDAILLLDACDELQINDMSSRMSGDNSYVASFFRALRLFPRLKVILTTRPNYIEPHYYPNSAFVITLKPFNIEQINKWIDFYNTIQEENKKISLNFRKFLCNP